MITLTTTLSRAGGLLPVRVTGGLLARLTSVGAAPPLAAGIVPWHVRLGEESPQTATAPTMYLGDY